MLWNRRYELKRYLASSLWIVPMAAIPVELALTGALHRIDRALGWTFLGLTPDGAQALYDTLITAMLSFVVFTFGSLLVAVQIASGQLTPRIIATTLLRDKAVKYIVALFIFTLFFAISARDRMGGRVHELVALIAALLGIACFAAFLFLIDYAARLLRPVSILGRIGVDGVAVVESVYPHGATQALADGPSAGAPPPSVEGPSRIVLNDGASGIVLAVNTAQLLAAAERSGGVIALVPQIGDFIATGDPLFRLYEGAVALDPEALAGQVVLGSERSLDQDPTFAFRIVVDIAIRALSPAINDPTTAVLAIDQLHSMLRHVGQRHLLTDGIADRSGRLRVYLRTPDWEDFVHLAFCEIAMCGANSLQIVRRLRAMIDNLMETLPAHCHAALVEQRGLLDRSIAQQFTEPELLALARVPDAQGLGGRAS